MNLTGPLEDFFQVGWIVHVALERFFPLTGFRTTESGIDCRVICVIIIASTLVFTAAWFTIAVPGLRRVGVAVGVKRRISGRGSRTVRLGSMVT